MILNLYNGKNSEAKNHQIVLSDIPENSEEYNAYNVQVILYLIENVLPIGTLINFEKSLNLTDEQRAIFSKLLNDSEKHFPKE
jgi:hypothetical protein